MEDNLIYAKDPDRAIGTIPRLSADEQAAVMDRWQGKVADYPRDETLATLFAARVAAQRDATAIVDGDRTLTFAELDALANAIAARLDRRGVSPGDRVGISLERSATAIAAMLAVTRLGATWLALDPANPAERLAWIAGDAGLACIVTQKAIAARLGLADPLVLDDLTAQEIAGAPPMPPVDVDPASIAYMVYTSGSTGRPKGVAMPHRPTLNRFAWMWREFPFGRDEVMCQKTALSFVDAVWEIFGPLLAGVPLVIIGNDVLLEPKAFLGALDRHGITRLLVVPSLLKTVVDADIDLMAAAPRLKMLFTSGERIPARLARAFRAKAPHVTLINLYGSSEVAADVTCEIVDRVDTDDVPIGRPIDNIRLYVLDASRNLVPPGQMGELHVGGEGLAAGYHGRPDLSAERFLPDPFSDADGARMFATGDLVHHLPDGRLVFRGRSDHQVKIRGSRVELGEVETALASQPGVAEAVAVARADDDGEMMLAAFITVQDGAKLGERDLRHALSQSLPGYTVPAQIRVLDQMPLNANGKIDRPALSDILAAAMPAGDLDAGTDTLPASGGTTERLLEIYREVLRRGDVAPDDSFAELGGHSLQVVKLFARIHEEFGADLPIATLFDKPSARLLAQAIDDAPTRPKAKAARVAPSPAKRVTRAPTTEGQREIFGVMVFDPDQTLTYNLPISLQIEGLLDEDALLGALSDLIKRHDALRARFEEDGMEMTFEPPTGTEISVIDLTASDPETQVAELERLRQAAGEMRFDATEGQLLIPTLVRLADDRHEVIFAIHHIVCDGWSIGVLLEDLRGLYLARTGAGPDLPPPQSIAELSAAEAQWRAEGGSARDLAYWKAKVRGRRAGFRPAHGSPTSAPQDDLGRAGARQDRARTDGTAAGNGAQSRRDGGKRDLRRLQRVHLAPGGGR